MKSARESIFLIASLVTIGLVIAGVMLYGISQGWFDRIPFS